MHLPQHNYSYPPSVRFSINTITVTRPCSWVLLSIHSFAIVHYITNYTLGGDYINKINNEPLFHGRYQINRYVQVRGPSNSEISFLGHLFKTSINHCQSLNLLSKSDSPKKFHERKYIIFSFAEHFQYLYNVTSSSPENPRKIQRFRFFAKYLRTNHIRLVIKVEKKDKQMKLETAQTIICLLRLHAQRHFSQQFLPESQGVDCFCSGRDGKCSWRLKIW